MPKSRAEIQKQYRQRLKEKNNAQYLAKERERRRKNYVPNEVLSQKARETRNKKNREYLKLYRQRKRAERFIAQQEEINAEDSLNSSGYESAQTSSQDNRNSLTIRMNFPNKSNGPRMRVSRELNETKTKLKALTNNYDELKRKYRTAMRSIQRTKKKTADKVSSPSTPRSSTERQMRHMKLSRTQRNSVRKELLFANALCMEIKSSKQTSSIDKKRILRSVVTSSNIMKKYRLMSQLSKKTGMCRNKLPKVAVRGITRHREIAKHRDKVLKFMERDDNSRNMPGKSDSKKVQNGDRKQTRILTDYLSTLYQKLVSENPTMKLSFSSFCRIRPKHILLTSFITRDTCLCTKHQNMSLTLKAIKKQDIGLSTSVNGEKMLESKEELLEKLGESTIDVALVGQWKRVPIESKGQKKMVMKIVESHMKKENFLDHVNKQIEEFESHVSRIKHQYQEIKRLKENLPDNHCIVHMDFSENYACKSLQEIQSAYWNQTSVTLHPIVVYYKVSESEELQHKSFVVVSDEMSHSATTVLTIIDKLIPEVRALDPNTTCIHYWTDSPTSQYRNKLIFHAIANHESKYGIHARWNYWEAGHGKGPCDGLGGTCKRMADEAVKTGKVAIQEPSDFYAWTQSQFCSLKSVKFLYMPSESCQQKATELGTLSLKPVIGTMKVHAVVGKGNCVVSVRNTSCYCDTCLSENITCGTWRDESLIDTRKCPSEETKRTLDTQNVNNYIIDEYVAAVYLEQWYIGQIKSIDNNEKEVEVSFLEKKKSLFQWPSRPDVIWVNNKNVLCKITNPKPSGKSKRMLVVKPDDIVRIEEAFTSR